MGEKNNNLIDFVFEFRDLNFGRELVFEIFFRIEVLMRYNNFLFEV